MKIQKGGLKLKDTSKIGFEAVFDMINSNSGRLNLFTYNSLKGFMITLDVNEDDSEYLSLEGNKFTKPVTSFILKFAIITPKNNQPLPIYKQNKKSSESKESYFEEAKLQQKVWKTSIQGGRPELCPPVANFSLFDNDNSQKLLKFLKSKSIGDTTDIFFYLSNYIDNNNDSKIGIIVMPRVEQSTTFSDFIYKKPIGTNFYGLEIEKEDKDIAKAYVAAQISRLFIDIGVIHFDLHMKNALIYLTPNKEIRCLLIDFGRASDIMNDKDDEHLFDFEKSKIKKNKNEFFNSLFDVYDDNDNDDDNKKRDFILKLLDNIALIDKRTNQNMYHYSDPNSYQMEWYEDFPRNSRVPIDAFDILKKTTTVEGTKITPNTINSYESEGYLVNFDRDISNFFVEFPEVQVCSDNNSEKGCLVMGGRKSKTYKKYKKHIKTRRLKKTKNIQGYK
jgi:hypothetical protein